jgi:hypothetical protein
MRAGVYNFLSGGAIALLLYLSLFDALTCPLLSCSGRFVEARVAFEEYIQEAEVCLCIYNPWSMHPVRMIESYLCV